MDVGKHPVDILYFWFTELSPMHHFAKAATLDKAIRSPSVPRWRLRHGVSCLHAQN